MAPGTEYPPDARCSVRPVQAWPRPGGRAQPHGFDSVPGDVNGVAEHLESDPETALRLLTGTCRTVHGGMSGTLGRM